MASFFERILSRYQCGFHKDYSAQQCLLAMMEKWKKIVDVGVFGALLTDLSKAFDCIPHYFIIAKLEAYFFHIAALKLIHDYLLNKLIRKQRVKVNNAYSSWKNKFSGVPEGSLFGPLLFNIHLRDLFYFLEDLDIGSYADDTTIYWVKKQEPVLVR